MSTSREAPVPRHTDHTNTNAPTHIARDDRHAPRDERSSSSSSSTTSTPSTTTTTTTMICAICQHQVRDALVTQCEHWFCGSCITTLLECSSMRPISCPVCRSPIFDVPPLIQEPSRAPRATTTPSSSSYTNSTSTSSSLSSSRDRAQHQQRGGREQEADQDAEAPCPNQRNGCSWQGAPHSLEHHLSSSCEHHPCPSHSLSLDSRCSWVGSIGAALIHQATECDADQAPSFSSSSCSTSSTTTKQSESWSDKAARAMLNARVFVFDVGDRTFRASERTLRSERGSVLDRLFSGEYALPRGSYLRAFDHSSSSSSSSSSSRSAASTTSLNNDRDGRDDEMSSDINQRVFIDCDARSFDHVLHWLRSYVSLAISISLSLYLSLFGIVSRTMNSRSLMIDWMSFFGKYWLRLTLILWSDTDEILVWFGLVWFGLVWFGLVWFWFG